MEGLNLTLIEIFHKKSLFNEFAIIVIVLSLFFTYSYIRRNVFKKLPPGPTGIPIFGYLPFLGKEPHKTLLKLSKKYGNVIGMYLGRTYVVVLNDWESKKAAFGNPAILDRPPGVFDQIPKALGFANSNGPVWNEQRRFSMKILKDLGLGKSGWEEMLQEEVNDTVKSLKGREGEPIDVLELFSSCFTNSMMALLFGYRLPYNHSTTKFLSMSLDELVTVFFPLSFSNFLPKLSSIFSKLGLYKLPEIKIQPSELNAHIEHATKNVIEGNDSTNELSFTKLYNKAVVNNTTLNLNNSYTEDSLIGNNQNLLLGGTDTNRIASIWLLVAMAHYPEIQSKVQEELDNVIGRENSIKFSDRKNTPYTFACVLESLRWRPIATINPLRMASEDTEILGYHVPKGTIITANNWAIDNDPKYWPNPEKFDPERFLMNDGKEVNTKMESFSPFSFGKRNCPGEHIALVNLLQYFVRFMQKCTVLPVEGADVNYQIILGLASKPKNVRLRFFPRK